VADAAPLVGGFRVSRCDTEQRTVILRDAQLGAPGAVGDADSWKLAGRLSELAFGAASSRAPAKVGRCCTPGAPHASKLVRDCIQLELALCERPIDAVAELFSRALEDVSLQGRAMGLRVDLHGLTGPRCLASDAVCGPFSRFIGKEDVRVGNFALPYDPKLPRRVSDPASPGGGACQHDGECAEPCEAWYHTGVRRIGSHGRFSSPDDYCGCVENECRVFRTARRRVTVDATLYLTERGERKAVDGRQLLFGFGNARQVPQVRLDRVERQLTRCYLGHEAELPSSFDVALDIPARGGHPGLTLSPQRSAPERCAREVLGWQSLPPPPSNQRTKVAGQIQLSLTGP
jgi:hypothetical protein